MSNTKKYVSFPFVNNKNWTVNATYDTVKVQTPGDEEISYKFILKATLQSPTEFDLSERHILVFALGG